MPDAYSHDPMDPMERELWMRWLSTHSGADSSSVSCPDVLVLAAFVDATLSPVGRLAVQEHLAGCGECLSAVLEARSIAAAEAPAVPATVLGAAKDLVAPRRRGELRRHRFQLSRWLVPSGWGAAAAAILGVCVIGYQIGTASAMAVQPNHDLAAEMTFGLFEPDGGDDPALGLMVEGES